MDFYRELDRRVVGLASSALLDPARAEAAIRQASGSLLSMQEEKNPDAPEP